MLSKKKRCWLIPVVSLLLVFMPNGYEAVAFPLRILKQGSPVPPFTLPTLSGGKGDVLGAEGEITVILFWSTDSESKRTRGLELLQALQTIGNTYGEKGVVVRSVNIDKDNRETLKKLVAEEGITVPVLLDEEEKLYGTYGLFIFPTVAVVDRDGTLKTAIGYTHNISEKVEGQIQIMLGLKTTEELDKELNPEVVIEPPLNVQRATRRLNLGRKLAEKHLMDMAGIEFKKAVELDPQNAEAHAELGAFYVRKGKLDEAFSELTKAIEQAPDSIRARFALGALYRRQGETYKSIAELEGVLALDPTHLKALSELGAVYEDMGRIDEALSYYRKALSIAFEQESAPN